MVRIPSDVSLRAWLYRLAYKLDFIHLDINKKAG